jgi:hypothetical protein
MSKQNGISGMDDVGLEKCSLMFAHLGQSRLEVPPIPTARVDLDVIVVGTDGKLCTNGKVVLALFNQRRVTLEGVCSRVRSADNAAAVNGPFDNWKTSGADMVCEREEEDGWVQ